MPTPADTPTASRQPTPLRSLSGARLLGWLGARELLTAAAALGLVASLGWTVENSVCQALPQTPAALAEQSAALDDYLETRCNDAQLSQCEAIKQIAHNGCRAKIRVLERRFDDYGEAIGSFRSDEGLEYSPTLNRWLVREILADKQVLGLPAY